jgi:membrane protein
MRKWFDKRFLCDLTRQTWQNLWEHTVFTHVYAIAFPSILAALLTLVVLLDVCAELLPDITGANAATAIAKLQEVIGTVMPTQAMPVVAYVISTLQAHPPTAFLPVPITLALWYGGSSFIQIITALNHIYGVKDTRPIWRERLSATLMALVQGFIVLGCLVLVLVWPYFVDWLHLGALPSAVIYVAQFLGTFVVLLGSFAMTFHLGPDPSAQRLWVTPGAVFGSVMFLIASGGFSFYIQYFAHYDALYGTLGGVVMLLFWIYLVSLVLVISAEINRIAQDANHLAQARRQAVDPQLADGGAAT